MFHNQILELQSQISYHQQQIEETEQELYQLKAFQSYGDEAFACMQEAIANIPDKYLDAFKEALLSLFDNPTTATTATQEEQYIEYIGETVAFDPEVDILHIGFKDQQLAEQWAHCIHHLENYGHRYVIEEAEHLPNYPIELKIKGVTVEDAHTLERIYNFSRLPDNIEYKESWKDDDYQSIEDIQKEDPNNIVVYPYEVKDKEKPKEKTYFELTGRPDLRPDTYEDLTPNITYSSSGRAYIGFNDYKESERFRERLDVPSLLDEAQIMNNHKWEVKFYADLDYVKQVQTDFEDEWTPEQKEQLDFHERLIRPAPDIFYDPKNNVCYVGFSNKERANNYGALLKELHEFTRDYHVTNPLVVTNCKYELQFMCSEDNAVRLAPLNLKKGLDHPSNQTIVSQWVKKELPSTVEDKEYPPISINDVQPGDIVARASKGRAHFQVICTREEGDGEVYALCECLINPIFKTAVGERFSLKELFLVERGAPALPPSGEAALSSASQEDADVF